MFYRPSLAPSLTRCNKNDPGIDQCFKKLIQGFFPLLRGKTPNYDFPIIDPFETDFVMFKFNNSNIGYDYTANATNVKMYGLSRIKIRSLKTQFKDDRMRLEIDAFVVKLLNTANYSLKLLTSILYLNYKSQGSYKAILRDVNFKAIVKGKLERKNGEDYMKVYQFDINPDPNDFEIHVSDMALSKK